MPDLVVVLLSEEFMNRGKTEWWEQIVTSESTGITFDLYDIGLVFFDKARYKQHYIVNFYNQNHEEKHDIHQNR